MLVFFLGTLSGCLIGYFLSRFRFRKKSKIEKQANQKFLKKIDERFQLERTRNNELERQTQNILKRFDLEKKAHAITQQLLEAEKETYLTAQQEFERSRQENEAALNELIEQERHHKSENRINDLVNENQQLKTQKDYLACEKEKIKTVLQQLESQCESQSKSIDQLSCQLEKIRADFLNKFALSITVLLPNLIFLRSSIELIDSDSDNFPSLLSQLKAISDGDFSGSQKVKATNNEWRECRVKSIRMMRIYFRQCNSESFRYQILISIKKDNKTQHRDFEWLKRQSKC
ncbi:MAG: hypothetical protein AAF921_14955 [Cyanobacteria bacterium P01_D01_bin.44]